MDDIGLLFAAIKQALHSNKEEEGIDTLLLIAEGACRNLQKIADAAEELVHFKSDNACPWLKH